MVQRLLFLLAVVGIVAAFIPAAIVLEAFLQALS